MSAPRPVPAAAGEPAWKQAANAPIVLSALPVYSLRARGGGRLTCRTF